MNKQAEHIAKVELPFSIDQWARQAAANIVSLAFWNCPLVSTFLLQNTVYDDSGI